MDASRPSPDRSPPPGTSAARAEAAPIVTIDGPAGTGKSSVARQLAERLGYAFLDTGAMYRAVAFLCQQDGSDPSDAAAAAAVAQRVTFDADNRLCVDDQPAGPQLRSLEVTQAASLVAQHAAVRRRLVELQRQFGAAAATVTEGRDQGTVVFPQAAHKFFLTASAEERARRRQRELAAAGEAVALDELTEQIRQRDARDESREVAPLKPAADAIVIDTTDLELAGVVDELVRRCTKR